MKRLLVILMVVLMLTGCTIVPDATPSGETAATTAPAVESTTAPVESETTGPEESTEPETTVSEEPTEPETTAPQEPTEPETTAPEEPTEPETTAPQEPTEPETTAPQEPTEPEYPTCSGHDSDPYVDVDVAEFYANYTTACCHQDAVYRSAHYLMSGELEVPDAAVTATDDQPMEGNVYIRNTDNFYLNDGNTYVVVDAQGQYVMQIHRGGAYITLEEVAAYMYAFGGSGDIPANYSSYKKEKPTSSSWGKYLRVNHSNFSGDTNRYPNEPELPNITGCGGSLQYHEMDIGTTGCGNNPSIYNNGSYINRGVARLVYARYDLNGDGVYSEDEVYVFYTYNHYNDFQEYLNYYGGWGEIFGYVTGGGTPSDYVETLYASFRELFAEEA